MHNRYCECMKLCYYKKKASKGNEKKHERGDITDKPARDIKQIRAIGVICGS